MGRNWDPYCAYSSSKFSQKITLNVVVEMPQLLDIENTDSKEKIPCLNGQYKMVIEKSMLFLRLIQTSWILSCTITVSVRTSN